MKSITAFWNWTSTSASAPCRVRRRSAAPNKFGIFLLVCEFHASILTGTHSSYPQILWEDVFMKALISCLTVFALVFVLQAGIQAGGGKDKEVTLKGKITCAKCDLGVEKKCATVIVVKEGGKDVTYYFDA